jgi:hypothetical protein
VSVTAKVLGAATCTSEGELAQRWLATDFMERAPTPTLQSEGRFDIDAISSTNLMTFGPFSKTQSLPAVIVTDRLATSTNMLLYGTLTTSGDLLEWKTIPSDSAQLISRLVWLDIATKPTPVSSMLDTLFGKPKANPLKGYEQYNQPNWDGFNAEPITAETLQYARWLLKIIPETFGAPDIAPSADGSIGLEWVLETGPLHKLFLDIGPGEEWRAYWRRRNGDFGRLPGPRFAPITKRTLQKLFNDLSQ